MGNKPSPFCAFLKVRVCVAMKAPVGLLSGRAVLRSKMEGHCPDKLGGICDRGYHGLHGARGESGGSLDRGHRVREKLVRGTLNDG